MMIERKTVSQCCSSDYCKGWNDAVDAMPKWISVKDELPKKGEMVFANTLYFFEVLQWDSMNELWVGSHGFHNKHYVTHWIPLPEPPKGA